MSKKEETLSSALSTALDIDILWCLDREGLVYFVDLVPWYAPLSEIAAEGDQEAQWLEGYICEFGLGVHRNHDRVFLNYERSSMQGYVPAIYDLARCYLFGVGVAPDTDKAVELYLRASRHDYAPADFVLSILFALGKDISDETRRATLRFQKRIQSPAFPFGEEGVQVEHAPEESSIARIAEALAWYELADLREERRDGEQILQHFFVRGLTQSLTDGQKPLTDSERKFLDVCNDTLDKAVSHAHCVFGEWWATAKPTRGWKKQARYWLSQSSKTGCERAGQLLAEVEASSAARRRRRVTE